MIENFHDPEVVLAAIDEHRIDTLVAIAATWARMLDVLRDDGGANRIRSLRNAYAMWQSASSSDVYDGWKDLGIELLNNFGSTAFANWVLIPPQDADVPRASLGRSIRGYTVAAIDPVARSITPVPAGTIGRMAVRGPSGLTYWNRPDEQERDVVDGWTLMDDLIRFDEHGFADYLGRTDFVISSAGYKIAPVEVENVLSRHAAVSEVGVIGSPDPIRQEIVTAFVALAPGVAPTDELKRELQDFVKLELTPSKYPRRVEFVNALPRDTVGKVQPRILQEWAQGRGAIA
jgi:2-aminobenzoate-CoA ligase